MAISVLCTACQYKFTIPEVGQRQNCPNCQSPVVAGKTVAEGSASTPTKQSAINKTLLGETSPPITFSCPRCKKSLEVASIEAGTKRPCPECGQRLQVPVASAQTTPHANLNKTILADTETPPSPSGIREGPPAAAPTASSGTAPGRKTIAGARSTSNRGLLIGGGLAALGVVFLGVLVCVASIIFIGSRNRQAAELLATETKQRIEKEAERQAELEKKRRDDQDAAARRAEQEKNDIEKAKAEAAAEQLRREQEKLDRQAKEEERRKRNAEELQALKDQEAKRAKEQKDAANKDKKGGGVIGVPPGGLVINGVLNRSQFDRYRSGCYCMIHPVPMKAGRTYVIGLFSSWDNYLHLEDPAGRHLISNDDGGGYPNARIIFTCPADGVFRIIVTSCGGGVTGPYTLRISN